MSLFIVALPRIVDCPLGSANTASVDRHRSVYRYTALFDAIRCRFTTWLTIASSADR